MKKSKKILFVILFAILNISSIRISTKKPEQIDSSFLVSIVPIKQPN